MSDRLFPLEPVPTPPPARRVPNPVWDALAAVFGEPSTRTNTRLRGRVVAELAEAGASPDEIRRRSAVWPFHFPGATLTETALVKHWDRLGRPPLRGSVRETERAVRRLRIVGGSDG